MYGKQLFNMMKEYETKHVSPESAGVSIETIGIPLCDLVSAYKSNDLTTVRKVTIKRMMIKVRSLRQGYMKSSCFLVREIPKVDHIDPNERQKYVIFDGNHRYCAINWIIQTGTLSPCPSFFSTYHLSVPLY